MNSSVVIEPVELEPVQATCVIRRQGPAAIPEILAQAAQTEDRANLFMKMFYIFGAYGQDDTALQMQSNALEFRRIFRVVSPSNPKIKLLALVAAGDMMDNAPLDFLIENSDVQLELMYVDAKTVDISSGLMAVPEHDLMYVAIGESPKNNLILDNLQTRLDTWPRPYINRPENIQKCARDVFCGLMRGAPNTQIANTVKKIRDEIKYESTPFTIRPIGSHAGVGFQKICSNAELEQYLSAYAVDQLFYTAEFIDYQSRDGKYRKYRIAMVEGKPFISHLAISDHWIVHYFPSGMELSQIKRDEERQAMLSFDEQFAKQHAIALSFIHQTLGLDYVVLDCAQSLDGKLIVFEADSGAWVHATDPVELFPYKPLFMQKIFDAFREMLIRNTKVS